MPEKDDVTTPSRLSSPPPRRWPQRALLIFVGFTVVMGVAAAFAPWTVSRGALREEIAKQIGAATGLVVYTTGKSTIAFLPQPEVRLKQISLIDPSGALIIRADELRGPLRLSALFSGRIEAQDILLERPNVEIELDGHLLANGAVARAADTRPTTPEAQRADQARLGGVAFHDGAIELKRNGVVEERVFGVNASLDWRIVSAPASLVGSGSWRGRAISMMASLARPAELMRGEASNITLQFKTPELEINANGPLTLGTRRQFSGRLVIATSASHEIFDLTGFRAPALLGRGGVTLDGYSVITPEGVSLSDAHVAFGQNQFQGVINLALNKEKPLLSGTLAARQFSGLSALSELPAFVGGDSHFSRDIFYYPFSSTAFDLDLRISANEARFGRIVMQDVAGAIFQHDNDFEITLTQASLYRGLFKARLALRSRAPAGIDLRLNAQAQGIDWTTAGWENFGDTGVNGAADLDVSLSSQGASPDELARNAEGQARMKFGRGEIIGLDIDRILRRIERHPLSSAADMRFGHTSFDSAYADMHFAGGAMTIDDALVEAPNFAMKVTGGARLSERTFDMRASVAANKKVTAEDSNAQETPEFAFDILGRWDNPTLTPDVQSFIRRSGPAKLLMPPREADKIKPTVRAPLREEPAVIEPHTSGPYD